jgi:putative flippase GtrA
MAFISSGNNLTKKNIKIFCRNIALLRHWVLKERLSINQFAKFIFIGVFNTALNYGTFFVLLGYTSYLISLVIAHVIGVLNSFIWNKYWTFGSKELRLDEFIKFNLLYSIYFIFNAAILIIMVDNLHFTPQMGQLIALPTLTIISFAGQKYWSFKRE